MALTPTLSHRERGFFLPFAGLTAEKGLDYDSGLCVGGGDAYAYSGAVWEFFRASGGG